MTRHLVENEQGAVTADWITLSAGIILLGMMVAFSVMNNSAGYLMAEFEDLNDRFAQDSQAIQVSSTDESSAAAANAAAAMDAARSLGGSGASASGIAIGSSGIDAIAAEEVAEPPIVETAIDSAPAPASASAEALDAAPTAVIGSRAGAAAPSESVNPGAGVPSGH